MKINELFESNSTFSIEFIFTIIVKVNLNNREFSNFSSQSLDILSEIGNDNNFKLNSIGQGSNTNNDYEISLRFKILNTEIASNDNIFNEKINSLLSTLNKEYDSFSFSLKPVSNRLSIVIKNSFPSIFISYPTIYLDNIGEMSFSGVNKFINCEHLYLMSTENITSNLLGILKIKSLNKLSILSFKNALIFKIIKKYISSKDILGCQDELIENGFSKFAKL
jgi:hypothetical protein